MTRVFAWLLPCCILLASSALAQFVWPTGSPYIGVGFFDPQYRAMQNRQHLGVDFVANVGDDVVAPVEGDIVVNETSGSDALRAYIVIRTAAGAEHVIGHISSPLAVGAHVAAGQVVGTARAFPSNSPLSGRNGRSLVHWGVNQIGVEQARRADWEWDSAPSSATRRGAERRGWVSP